VDETIDSSASRVPLDGAVPLQWSERLVEVEVELLDEEYDDA
jgi:hypothetical protein